MANTGKTNPNKNTRVVTGDRINRPVTDTDKFNATGVTLYVFLRGTCRGGERKAANVLFMESVLPEWLQQAGVNFFFCMYHSHNTRCSKYDRYTKRHCSGSRRGPWVARGGIREEQV